MFSKQKTIFVGANGCFYEYEYLNVEKPKKSCPIEKLSRTYSPANCILPSKKVRRRAKKYEKELFIIGDAFEFQIYMKSKLGVTPDFLDECLALQRKTHPEAKNCELMNQFIKSPAILLGCPKIPVINRELFEVVYERRYKLRLQQYYKTLSLIYFKNILPRELIFYIVEMC